jgi:tetratricopeptide (TPR) repeat protein
MANEWFNKAIAQDPNYADAHSNLGNALRAIGSFDEAVAAYKRAIQINSGFAEAYYNLGSILIELNELDDAITNFNKTIEIDPRHKVAYIGLGNVLSDMGEIDKALASYRKVIEINPEHAEAYRFLSKNKKFSEYDDDIQAMESLYASEGISDEQKMHLAFGLGKAYEDLGEYEKSMEFILQATRLKRTSFDYSISEAEDLFSNIKETFSLEFFADRKGMGNPDRTPIFILGMPRSGTSLVEQILASHPDVFGAGELNDLKNLTKEIPTADASRKFPESIINLDAEALENLGMEYIKRVRNHSEDSKYITDKMPHNFLRIGLIKAILPNARIIHCIRDPVDTCLSFFKNYFPSGHHYSYDMAELGQYYNLYLDLMAYWRRTLPGFIYDLSYESLVAEQEKQIMMLLDYCNLPWDNACLNFHKTRRKVKTASNAQVRRPIYKDSVKLWKRYEKQLEPLRAAIDG